MEDVILILSTFPSIEQARQIGTVLVEKQLAACVNLLPGVESIYRWQGTIETSAEVLALIKTSVGTRDACMAELSRLHPFEVPELVAIVADFVSPAYKAWVNESTTAG